ncbi:MAG: sensor histidine kinase [Vicinamibacteria bacterium]
MRLPPLRVRTRLTLWYAGILAGVLALYLSVTLFFLHLSLRGELDANLHVEEEEVEEYLHPGPDGAVLFAGHDYESRHPGLVEVWADGTLVYRSARLGQEGLGRPPGATPRAHPISRVLRDGTPVRIRESLEEVEGRPVLLRVAMSEKGFRREWDLFKLAILLGLPAAVAIAGMGGHWLARRALAPLDRMAREAERLTGDNLGERLTVEDPNDELGHLARVFNMSLARIEDSFAELRRFTADASHELRTPLTAIRAVGEVALQDHRDPEQYRETIGSMLEEVDRLSRLVEGLLVLSRGDTGGMLRRQEVGLLELAERTVSLLEILAEEKEQRIEVTGDGGIRVEADPLLLRQALVNLTDNAIKFSPRGSTIKIDVGRNAAGEATIDIGDEGPGIPEADRARVFERFYRVDSSRSREQGGAGLGLSIARWAVEKHGGRIELRSEGATGSTFRIVLGGFPPSAGPQQAREV